jgi:maltose alpha-D-glucosyltransferase/alpha-amylase
MLDGNGHRLEMAQSLQLTMPGTPVLRYGDEIGMGENLDLPEREAIRTPMQWDNTVNAGFSKADPGSLPVGVIDFGPFDYHHVNVNDERRDPESLLVWFERMLHTLRECPEIGTGEHDIIDAGPPHVLVHRASGPSGEMLFLHNLADKPCQITVDLKQADGHRPLNVAADSDYGEDVDPSAIELTGFGYRWIRLRRRP